MNLLDIEPNKDTWENERARVGEKEELDVLSAPITDGWKHNEKE